MRLFIIALTLSLFSAISPASAQSQSNYCGKTSAAANKGLPERLVGQWTMKHYAGYVEVMGITMPYPPAKAEQVALTFNGTDLYVAANLGPDSSMKLDPTMEAPWQYLKTLTTDGTGVKPAISDEQVKAFAGCKAAALPRYIGHYDEMIEDAMRLKMDFRFIVISDKLMIGILSGGGMIKSGQQFLTHRAVTLKR